MLINAALIFGFVILTSGMAIRRLMDVRGMPAWTYAALLLFSAVPLWVGYIVLNPGEPIASTQLTNVHDVVEFQVPEGYSLLISGIDATTDKPEPGRANYTITLRGDGWTQKAIGQIQHKLDPEKRNIDALGGSSVKDSKTKGGRWGEELEQRFDVAGTGDVKAELILLTGGAVDSLKLDIIPSPPPGRLLLGIAGVAAMIGLLAEVRFRAVQVAGDMAFLTLFAYFLRDKVTAADALREAAGAALAGGVIGWGAVGGLAWLLLKAGASKEPEASKDA